jgi:protoporphyrinogen oxidase
MREKVCAMVIAAMVGASAQSACAMSSQPTGAECRVAGAEKLPSKSGGADALCAAIREAFSATAPGLRYEAEVTVISRSMLSAKIRTADGREIPEQRHAVMDSVLTKSSFERFARSLARQLVKTDK